jgi:hypothetical protein
MLNVHFNILFDVVLKANAGEEQGSYQPSYVGKLQFSLRTQTVLSLGTEMAVGRKSGEELATHYMLTD